jgi:regulator of sirC expression with transglutaminase-like and TPR domain
MIVEDIGAMVALLDDTDQEVVSIISGRIKKMGVAIIPELENVWAKNEPNPEVQTKIEYLLHELHFENLKDRLKDWASQPQPDLLTGLWLVATYRFPNLQLADLKKQIQSLYLDVYTRTLPDMHPLDLVKIIDWVIFENRKFEPNVKNFHSPANSLFNLVMEQKKSNPVGLACLYILIAEKLNVPIFGVNLPNLFVLIHDHPQATFYINAFNKGQIFSKKDIDNYLIQMNLPPTANCYEACGSVDIVIRILNNLAFAFDKIKEFEKKMEIEEFIQLLKNH